MLTMAAIVPLLAQEENTRSRAAKLIAGRVHLDRRRQHHDA
jgi:hypothetical protein